MVVAPTTAVPINTGFALLMYCGAVVLVKQVFCAFKFTSML